MFHRPCPDAMNLSTSLARRPDRRVMLCTLFVACVGAVPPAAAQPGPATRAADLPMLKVQQAWIRPADKGQSSTGAHMVVTSRHDSLLVGLSSPVAASGEVHRSELDGSVMRMRPLPHLALPGGRPVSLQPGNGHTHLMLLGLKAPLELGQRVPITLQLQMANGDRRSQVVEFVVATAQPALPRPKPQEPPIPFKR